VVARAPRRRVLLSVLLELALAKQLFPLLPIFLLGLYLSALYSRCIPFCVSVLRSDSDFDSSDRISTS
jgi:hypothetical protein